MPRHLLVAAILLVVTACTATTTGTKPASTHSPPERSGWA